MTGWITSESRGAQAQAGALATALEADGFRVTVHKTGGHTMNPCMAVSYDWARRRREPEYVYCAPDDDGKWWFWWSSVERIAPAGEIPIAAFAIRGRLTWHPR